MITLSNADIDSILLTLKLATIVTSLLMLFGTPLAWWLARSQHPLKSLVASLVALPLVLPPTVLGFYLLIAFGTQGPLGQLTQDLGLGTLAFSFTGLVIASMLYSLPFVVQPLQSQFETIDQRLTDVAATLGANRFDRFIHVVLPLAKPGFLTAAVLGFTHTVGEFGVVLMIGGNIPQETRVVSVQLYEHVETLNYAQAHSLGATLVIFSFSVLLLLYVLNHKRAQTLM